MLILKSKFKPTKMRFWWGGTAGGWLPISSGSRTIDCSGLSKITNNINEYFNKQYSKLNY